MRLTAEMVIGAGVHPALVWDAEMCRVVEKVVWADDETMQYCQHELPQRVVFGHVATVTRQARKIVIAPDWKAVIINPAPDAELLGVETPKAVEA